MLTGNRSKTKNRLKEKRLYFIGRARKTFVLHRKGEKKAFVLHPKGEKNVRTSSEKRQKRLYFIGRASKTFVPYKKGPYYASLLFQMAGNQEDYMPNLSEPSEGIDGRRQVKCHRCGEYRHPICCCNLPWATVRISPSDAHGLLEFTALSCTAAVSFLTGT